MNRMQGDADKSGAHAELASFYDSLPFSDAQRRYIHAVLMPIIMPMLTELMAQMPHDPSAFMIKRLRDTQGSTQRSAESCKPLRNSALRQSAAKRGSIRFSVLGGLVAPKGGGFQSVDLRHVWDVFEKEARLGSGAFGTVYRGKDRQTGNLVAVKQMLKTSEGFVGEDAVAEFKICAEVSHPHIMRVFAFFDEADAVYIVSDIAAHGELMDYLAKNKQLANETGISTITSQVLLALVYLHSCDMVHHDVKPPNILVTDQHFGQDASVPVVVLADFGTARLCESTKIRTHAKGDPLADILGTPEFCGPEVFEGRSGDRTDVYALGVTLFELLSGEKPFEIQMDLFSFIDDEGGGEDRFQQMRDMQNEADWTRIKGVSQHGRDLVKKMMAKAFDDRPTARECARDPWFSAVSAAGCSEVSEAEGKARVDRLLRRANLGFYAKALLNMMATQIAGDELQQEREIFMRLDRDGSGTVCAKELLAALGSQGLNQERAEMVLRCFDIDRSGEIGFNEWLGASMYIDTQDTKKLTAQVRSIFSQLDVEQSGKITLDQLKRRFGEQSKDNGKVLDAFFRQLDTQGTGSVSFPDFMLFWQEHA